MRNTLKLITAPAEEPVTLAFAKLHARGLEAADDDVLLQSLLVTSREAVEGHTGRRLVTQTVDLLLDYLPAGEFDLPCAPLQSITHVKYIDSTGALLTLAQADYKVAGAGAGGTSIGRIAPSYTRGSWPATRCEMEAVQIRLVCGYGVAAAVPYAIKAAICLLVAHLYEHREENPDFEVHELPFGAFNLLQPYWVAAI